ncbi:hypothetical protein ACOME3_007591 [Neoechinorhynchus agilis]
MDNSSSGSSSNLDQSAVIMMQRMLAENIKTPSEALCFLGSWFRNGLALGKWRTDLECGKLVIDRCVFTHLEDWESKYFFGVFCMRKLYLGVQRTPAVCRPDPIDTTMMHELITPGQTVASVIVDKIYTYIRLMRMRIVRSFPKSMAQDQDIRRAIELISQKMDLDTTTAMFENFFSTGNLSARSNPFSANQSVGWVILAERINFLRYIAHFRSVHRGASFTSTRVSSIRRLCPESFGFICPVNTPDGTLCGLLNHLSINCTVTSDNPDTDLFVSFMREHGLIDRTMSSQLDHKGLYTVLLDGNFIGFIEHHSALTFVQFMREQKVLGESSVPQCTEFALVEDRRLDEEPDTRTEGHYTIYPALYIFTSFARLMRPVFNLAVQGIEYIGTFEQVFLGVATDVTKFVEGFTTHHEIVPYGFLSLIANLTPLSEFNQSPRNMYQCQLLKQTMGTPCHYSYRSDQKLYKLTYGQSPLLRTKTYDFCEMDNYPMGTNAIVAVYIPERIF